MNRRILLAGLCLMGLCLVASLALAKPGVVKTKDGRSLEGDIDDKGTQGVVITTRVGQITLAQADVAAIAYAENIKEAYQQRLAKLPKNAVARDHLDLAKWLYDNREYELALKEIDTALNLDPNSADAVSLRTAVEKSASLDRGRGNGAAAGTGAAAAGTGKPAAAGTNPKDRKLLDADQINIIKQGELTKDDNVTVRFSGDVKNKFIKYDNQDIKEFSALPPVVQAQMILKNGTADMRKDVHIVSDPRPLAEFKRLQTTLLQGCATTGCHGGPKGGSFVLYSGTGDDVTYTNFYILTQYTTDVDGVRRKALDRTYPENSLILQFALPRDKSEFDHPDVLNWAPVIRNLQDPKYQTFLGWMRNSLVSVDPKYNFDIPLPGKAPTTRPATEPAKDPAKEPAKEPAKQAAKPPAANSTPRRPPENQDQGNNPQNSVDEARQRIRNIPIHVPGIGG